MNLSSSDPHDIWRGQSFIMNHVPFPRKEDAHTTVEKLMTRLEHVGVRHTESTDDRD